MQNLLLNSTRHHRCPQQSISYTLYYWALASWYCKLCATAPPCFWVLGMLLLQKGQTHRPRHTYLPCKNKTFCTMIGGEQLFPFGRCKVRGEACLGSPANTRNYFPQELGTITNPGLPLPEQVTCLLHRNHCILKIILKDSRHFGAHVPPEAEDVRASVWEAAVGPSPELKRHAQLPGWGVQGQSPNRRENHLSQFNECALKRLKIKLTFLAPHHKTCHYK